MHCVNCTKNKTIRNKKLYGNLNIMSSKSKRTIIKPLATIKIK